MELGTKHNLPPAYKEKRKVVRLCSAKNRQREEEITKGNTVREVNNIDNA